MFFLQFVQIEYQNLDYKNYLVLRQSRNVQLIDYCCRMLEQNKITGLLPVYSKRLNNKIDFFYDISGKKRLGDYLQQHHCADEQGRQILLNIAETIKSLPQYFLKQQLCIMDLQYVFINDALQVFFPLLPLAEMLENRNDIQSFFRRIVSDYFVTEANNQFYDGLLKYLSRQDFDLNEFVKRLQPEKLENKSSANQVQPKIEPLPVVSEPENNKESKHGLHWPFAGKSGKKKITLRLLRLISQKNRIKSRRKRHLSLCCRFLALIFPVWRTGSSRWCQSQCQRRSHSPGKSLCLVWAKKISRSRKINQRKSRQNSPNRYNSRLLCRHPCLRVHIW